jgi:hypothetical protein
MHLSTHVKVWQREEIKVVLRIICVIHEVADGILAGLVWAAVTTNWAAKSRVRLGGRIRNIVARAITASLESMIKLKIKSVG